jgi:tetratricopeptide (TPR) repeat protein
MTPRPARLPAVLAVLVSIVGTSARGSAQDLTSATRAVAEIETDATQLRKVPVRGTDVRSPTYVEERLADGQLYYRLRDYVRASIVLTDIVDNFAQHPGYPDALFYLGESLFQAGDYLGARARYRLVLDRSDEALFRGHVQAALGRLIEIAIHIRDFTGVDAYFERLSRLPPAEVESATAYFRAKYLYNLAVPMDSVASSESPLPQPDPQQLETARQAFEAVSSRSPYYAQARYFVGVTCTLRGQYSQAIEAFKRVMAVPVTGERGRDVQELARLALGRLYYETGQLEAAVAAYEGVERTSRHFDTALYEVTWVHIRAGDATRAERALELLSIAQPDSRYIPDGKLLRGNLLIREGRYADAHTVFEQVTREFQPVRDELAAMVAGHEDPQLYFRELVRTNLDDFDAEAFLPPLAARWSIIEGDMARAVSAVGDLAQTGQLIRETTTVAARLASALGSQNPVNVFRDLRNHRERSIALRNRLALIRRQLIEAVAASSAQYNSAEVAAVRAERKQLEAQLQKLPTKPEHFEGRNTLVDSEFLRLRRQLAELELTMLGMEARITATRSYMAATMKSPEQQAGVAAILAELEQQRAAITEYRESVVKVREEIETARVHVGVGDGNFQVDEALRTKHAALVARERQLVAALGGGTSAQVQGVFQRVDATEASLQAHDQLVDQVVQERVTAMQQVLAVESAKVDEYSAALMTLREETVEVVGGVVYENFRKVERRFYDLVLKADVGIVDVGWAERESARMRVDALTRERSRILKALDDEFVEIMDERGTP